MSRDSYAVRLYEPDLAEACDRFSRRMWPKSGDDDASAGDGNAGTTPSRLLFLKGGEVIGHVATVPVRLAVARRLLDASWAVGLVVVPEHRNGPVAPLLMKKLNETVEIGLTLHVEEAALRVFKGVGWRHLGVIPQYVRVLNARAFVRTFSRRGQQFLPARWSRVWAPATRAAGPVAALVRVFFASLAVAGATVRRGRPGATVLEECGFDASYTRLAERLKGKLGVWVFRDEQYLASRYGRRMGAYRLHACRERGRLLGYCIVKIRQFEGDPRMGDIRMGTLVDCVFDPDEPGVLDSLLGSAVALCRREGIDVVFCSASLREIGRHLRRHAFVRMPGTLNAAFYDQTRTIGEDVPLESWHLMRGDSDADENC
jgi:hypothetical protein